MLQTKLGSFYEACANTAIGYVINLGGQLIIYPFFGATFTFTQNLQIGALFTIISIARGFFIRRWFNGALRRAAERLAL